MELPVDGAYLGLSYQACDISIIQESHPRRSEQALALKMKFLCFFRTTNFINLHFSEFSQSSFFIITRYIEISMVE